ncbi:hypothetical protein, partial [Halomonas sp. LBP4]|uniref:hypothetical protein n=1 Tax=Halomonas sp. LBP4 TaxID=2044917 RepID=UPI000D95DF11
MTAARRLSDFTDRRLATVEPLYAAPPGAASLSALDIEDPALAGSSMSVSGGPPGQQPFGLL